MISLPHHECRHHLSCDVAETAPLLGSLAIASGLGRILLLNELIQEIGGLPQPAVILHLGENLSGGKELLLCFMRVTEGLKTTLLGQISHSVLGRLKNFGDIGLRQTAI